MSYDPNNIFAKMIKGEMPCVKLYEDEHTFSFMDIMPQSEGHSLVIPKVGARDIFDLPPEAAAQVIQTTQKVARAVKAATGAPGIMLAQLSGQEAGQTIFHTHFHIIPRWEGVDLKLHARDMVAPATLEPLAEKIRAAIS